MSYNIERERKAKDHRNKMSRKYQSAVCQSVTDTLTYDGKVDNASDIEIKSVNIRVIDTDTVSAASMYKNNGKVALLNFASFKHPGGGFLKGSLAQEESLCHESNLYNILAQFQKSFYEYNHKHLNNSLYLDRALYTPKVIFRDNEFTCDVITCAAPNKSAAMRYNRVTKENNSKALKSRIKFILDIAKANNVDTLILGAYGCGVFGQDPYEVARIFKEYLDTEHKCFDNVVFAIPRGRNNNLGAFKNVFKM